MTETPKKLVQWEFNDISFSDMSSPFFDGSMASMVSTSSIEYINSQLVAHGFAPSPGLSLDGISNSDMESVVKCLLGMLSQRVEDMSRTEELTTKLRTLSYDHERLISMHRTATETTANAEREMNLHKSRLLAATRALQTSETAHKHTTAELQRTRTIVQSVRATHQSEIKKKEKDIERMSEKWSKIADAQTKLMAIPSGMRCANVSVATGLEIIGKGRGFLDIALEEAEKARSQLGAENLHLRKLVLSTVNELQYILHQTQCIASNDGQEPTPFSMTTLFPLHPAEAAGDKLSQILVFLRERLTVLSEPSTATSSGSKNMIPVSDGEMERLQSIVNTLKEELERSRQQILRQAAETQAMFDKFADDHRIVTDEIGEMSMELMSAPLRDTEKERLDNIKRELDQERQKFTEAAIKLGRERAEIEAERIKLLDEKRSWQVEMMLADLPPTPQPSSSPKRTAIVRSSPKKSPRKSPAKVRVGKAGIGTGRKTTRVSRLSLASPIKVMPSYETEVIPPILAPTFISKPLATSLLPTSFVLPPPSPHTSLPSQPALLSSIPSLILRQSPPESTTPLSPSLSPAEPSPSTPPVPQRLFPVAKPFAQRMIHAYSPAKPSPLSRILLLGNSPNSPDMGLGAGDVSSLMQPVVEEDERPSGIGEPLTFPTVYVPPHQQMSLATELGIPESPPESPLQEKKLEPNVTSRLVGAGTGVITTKGRVFHLDPKRFTTKEKGKRKAESAVPTTHARVRTSGAIEKENSDMKPEKVFSAPTKISPPGFGGEAKKPVKPAPRPITSVVTSRARLAAKLPPPSKTGPRRVPIDSAEAPPVGKGWRG